jgi:predicted small integral membrane protein
MDMTERPLRQGLLSVDNTDGRRLQIGLLCSAHLDAQGFKSGELRFKALRLRRRRHLFAGVVASSVVGGNF